MIGYVCVPHSYRGVRYLRPATQTRKVLLGGELLTSVCLGFGSQWASVDFLLRLLVGGSSSHGKGRDGSLMEEMGNCLELPSEKSWSIYCD